MALVNGNLFTDDGVLIETVGTIRTINGLWTVVVTLHPPNKPDIGDWKNLIWTVLEDHSDVIAEEDGQIWVAQLNALSKIDTDGLLDPIGLPDGHVMTYQHRVKRGLLNIVGTLSKSLFGTATAEDVRALQHAVAEAQENTQNLYHNQRDLLSVFNKTRHIVAQNALDIEEIQREMHTLFQNIRIEANETNALIKSISKLDFSRRMDLNLQQMKDVVHHFRLQQQVFHQQRVQLERGFLTEDILSVHILQDVLRQMRERHLATLPPTWYYENLRVLPLWEQQHELAYRLTIPGLSTEEYLHYKLRYFGVKWGPSHIRKLVGRDEIAINTITASSFVPENNNCLGKLPLVCHPAKIELQSKCEANLVAGVTNPGCNFYVYKRGNISIDLHQHSSNKSEIVLVGYEPTEVITRCVGQSAIKEVITGPVIIKLNPDCSIETKEWRVYAIQKFSSKLDLAFHHYMSLPSINITWPERPPIKIAGQLNSSKQTEIPWDDLPELIEPVFTPYQPSEWDQYGWYIVGAGGFSLLIILLIITLIWCHKNGKLRPLLFKRPEPFQATLNPEEQQPLPDNNKVAVSYWPKPSESQASTSTPVEAFELKPLYGKARSLLENATAENWSKLQFSQNGEGRV